MTYPFGLMDFILVFSSLMSLQALQSWSHGWFVLISNLMLISDLIISMLIIKWFSELNKNSHLMLFCQQSLLQLQSHSLSHTVMGSIYLCYVEFSLVTLGNGVMTNDWWCRDETESLLWCTHGWAARHALLSWLIVVIHYETILMCYPLWTFSQNDRCILSRYVAIF
jgi:hypothetical protein